MTAVVLEPKALIQKATPYYGTEHGLWKQLQGSNSGPASSWLCNHRKDNLPLTQSPTELF